MTYDIWLKNRCLCLGESYLYDSESQPKQKNNIKHDELKTFWYDHMIRFEHKEMTFELLLRIEFLHITEYLNIAKSWGLYIYLSL